MPLDQMTFDLSEQVADFLDDQAGLEHALIGYLSGRLSPKDEQAVFAIIHGMGHCRNGALHAAGVIARSGKA